MGRNQFYAIVDETHRRMDRANGTPGSWDGYQNNEWYQKAREKSGRKRK